MSAGSGSYGLPRVKGTTGRPARAVGEDGPAASCRSLRSMARRAGWQWRATPQAQLFQRGLEIAAQGGKVAGRPRLARDQHIIMAGLGLALPHLCRPRLQPRLRAVAQPGLAALAPGGAPDAHEGAR